MAQGSYDLKDQNPGTIRVYCPACHRWSQAQRDKLIEQHGAGQSLPDLLAKVQPCDKPNTYSERCKLIYWDMMADSARATALGKGGIPEAWRDRMLPPWWDSIRDICEDLNRPPASPAQHASYYDRKDLRR